MARTARAAGDSGIYHVMLRGINRQRIFEDDEDRDRFLEILKKSKEKDRFDLIAWCLMPNHVHLLIHENEVKLGTIFRRIGASYVYWYNGKYGRTGHLFQDRFKSEPVEDDAYFLTVIRYIHQNPVKAGLCERPEDYAYSSLKGYFEDDGLHDSGMVRELMDGEQFMAWNAEAAEEKCMDMEDRPRKYLTDSRATVENYVRYLESANLIYQSWPIEMSGRKPLKAQPKIYIADAAIRNAVLMDDEMLTDPDEPGKIVETAVYKHAAAFYYQQAVRVGYSRGAKDKEVDIVVNYPNIRKILIEVKYREQAPIPKDDAIIELSRDAGAAIIVTKRADDYGTHDTPDGRKLIRMPAFAFLYLLGNAEKHGRKGKEEMKM